MKRSITALINLVVLIVFSAGGMSAPESSAVTAAEARQKLMEGNKRYVAARLLHPNQTARRRAEVAGSQHPFTAIVTCADSRVPPEILFDQGLGDLFVIRLAGNILDDAVLASLEYAVEHLGVKFIMVLGHERCVAVETTLKGGETPGHISSLVKTIQPAVDQAKKQAGDLLDNAVRANISMVVQQLKSSVPILSECVRKGDLAVIGAYYDLDDGTVAMLP